MLATFAYAYVCKSQDTFFHKAILSPVNIDCNLSVTSARTLLRKYHSCQTWKKDEESSYKLYNDIKEYVPLKVIEQYLFAQENTVHTLLTKYYFLFFCAHCLYNLDIKLCFYPWVLTIYFTIKVNNFWCFSSRLTRPLIRSKPNEASTFTFWCLSNDMLSTVQVMCFYEHRYSSN